MKKLTFKVSTPKEGSIKELIKEINEISCRIQLDFEKRLVIVQNVSDDMIDIVIELIDKYYTMLGVDIDNIIEVKTVPKVIDPQVKEDLIIKKVTFENEYVENLVNKFLKTAYWAMYKMEIPEREIGEYIITSMNEISMRYNKGDYGILFAVGDVVDCNYGVHLIGEINGGHVPAIVCNISDSGMIYVVPITRGQSNIISHSYLPFNTPEDIVYSNEYYGDAIALLDKGKYVRPERVRQVIGKTTFKFFSKLLNQLATTFDFTDNIVGNKKGYNGTETIIVSETPNKNVKKLESTTKKISCEEAVLLETIGDALDKLDATKKAADQIDSFLVDIGMPTNENLLKQCFVIACDVKKINYENVILELHKLYPTVKEEIIKTNLKEVFKKWLKKNPVLIKKCPKIALTSVLKVFAKKFA